MVQEFVGKVVSDRMVKSVLVAVKRLKAFPKYRVTLERSRKFMAHDENNSCGIGDLVKIQSCRPLSKRKAFRVTRVIHKAKIFDPAAAEARAQKVIAQRQEMAKENVSQAFGIHRGFAASGIP